jgi:hypothetical protein
MLPIIALFLGLAMTIYHLLALLVPEPFKIFARRFPRSSFWGKFLFGITLLWALGLALTTDLGEFSSLRNSILVGIIIGGGLFGWLVPDFLSIRSIGFLALLAARPLLQLTFLQSGKLSCLLSILAYFWIVVGLFSVGMPYLLRNLITFITVPSRSSLWSFLSLLGLLYGLLLIMLSIFEFLR